MSNNGLRFGASFGNPNKGNPRTHSPTRRNGGPPLSLRPGGRSTPTATTVAATPPFGRIGVGGGGHTHQQQHPPRSKRRPKSRQKNKQSKAPYKKEYNATGEGGFATTTRSTYTENRTVSRRQRADGDPSSGPDGGSSRKRGGRDTLVPMQPLLENGETSPRWKGKSLRWPPSGGFKARLRWFLPWINSVALLGVVVALIVYPTVHSNSARVARGSDTRVQLADGSAARHSNAAGRSVLFTLIPTDKLGKTMKMSLHRSGMNYEKLLHYDVCCYRGEFFVCRSVTRNVAVDCIIEKDKSSGKLYALILVKHPDMNGARCRLSWLETPTKLVEPPPLLLQPVSENKVDTEEAGEEEDADDVVVPKVELQE